MRMHVVTFAALFLGNISHAADRISDAQSEARNVRSMYQGSVEIDSQNPAEFLIETIMARQSVALSLRTAPLGTSAFHLLTRAIHSDYRASSPLVETRLAHLRVWIDRCNVSQQLVRICNESDCWAEDATRDREAQWNSLDGTFEMPPDADMAAQISMNSLNPAECPSGTFRAIEEDHKFRIRFEEGSLPSCPAKLTGGKVLYEITLKNVGI